MSPLSQILSPPHPHPEGPGTWAWSSPVGGQMRGLCVERLQGGDGGGKLAGHGQSLFQSLSWASLSWAASSTTEFITWASKVIYIASPCRRVLRLASLLSAQPGLRTLAVVLGAPSSQLGDRRNTEPTVRDFELEPRSSICCFLSSPGVLPRRRHQPHGPLQRGAPAPTAPHGRCLVLS